MRLLPSILFLVVAGAAALPAQLKVGDKAPAFRAERLLNTRAKTLADLVKGRVVLYVYVSAAESACAGCVPRVHSILEKYGRQGFTAVFVTRDGPGEIQKFVDATRLLAAVALEKELKSYDLYGFATWPCASLVGVDGRIAWIGHPQDVTRDEVEKHLRSVKSPTPPDQPLKAVVKLPKAYAGIVADAAAGRLGTAWSALDAALKGRDLPELDEALLSEARRVLEDILLFEQGCAEREDEQHHDADARKLYLRVAAAFQGQPAAEKAQERADELAKKSGGS